MKYSLISFITFIFLLSLGACSETPLPPLEAALKEAGDNRTELEKVLAKYSRQPADSLKYRAACFLIEHMPGLHYYEGELLAHYSEYYKALHLYPNRTPEQLLDSIKKVSGNPSPHSLKKKYDIQEIDSALLCENIEYSFKVWREFPWCSHLSFTEFCELILPYRTRNERLENWRPQLYAQYAPIARQLAGQGCTDPIQAAVALTDRLRQAGVRFTMTAPPYMPALPPSYGKYLSGSCADITSYVVCAARSIGIPCAIDFVPLRGNANSGHLWTAYPNRQDELYLQDFLGEIVPAGGSKLQEQVRPLKVYRYTYAANREEENRLKELTATPYPFFTQTRFHDITSYYRDYHSDSLSISTEMLYDKKPKAQAAYLCHARKQDWIPVAWAPLSREGLTFRHITKGNLVRVMTMDDRLRPLSDPFYIEDSGELTFYTPSDHKRTVTLFAKTNLNEESRFFKRMINGVFEGSGTPDFAQRDTLFLITQAPYRLYTQVDITTDKPYRYVRYYGADSTACNVAEISFYENGAKIPVAADRIIGTPGCWQGDGSHEYTNAFDGLTTTSFDYKEPCGGWTGVDFGTPRYISHIAYTPRNRDNFIRPGDEYELFFHDKIWISLGRTVADSDSLHYTGIPENTLLYLKNHSRGYDERIFLYEDGKQIWK